MRLGSHCQHKSDTSLTTELWDLTIPLLLQSSAINKRLGQLDPASGKQKQHDLRCPASYLRQRPGSRPVLDGCVVSLRFCEQYQEIGLVETTD